MAKQPMSPLGIMNLMGSAAQKKSQQSAPNDHDEDDLPSKDGKSPASAKSKKVAAMKEQEKKQGKAIPPKAKGM